MIKLNRMIGLWMIVNLSSCSHFPDKEKDYQLTAEIPELKVPSDLSNKANLHNANVERNAALRIQKNTKNSEMVMSYKDQPIAVYLIERSGEVTRIRVEDRIERTWRTVGKALTHHSIEITGRNELAKVYSIQYDPDFKKVDDGSLWDEFLFMFGSDPAQEKQFNIKLDGNKDSTQITMHDANDLPLSEGPGLKLLELLYKTIKADLDNIN